MKQVVVKVLLATTLACGMTAPASADFDDGVAAYEAGDYATALREFHILAEQGHAAAQNNLGLMYLNGDSIASQRANAQPGQIVQPQSIVYMKNPSKIGPRVKELLRLRADYIHLAEASRKTGFSQSYLSYRRKVIEINEDLRYVNGMTAIYDLNYGQVARANKLWSDYIGQKVNIQARSDGTFFLNFEGGNKEIVTKDFLIKNLRRIFDSKYLEKQQSAIDDFERKRILKGVPKNYAEAAKWFRKAAEQGNVAAQYNFGVMYDNGKGVPQNYTEAYKWISLAKAQGNDLATEALQEVVSKMTPNQIAEAQRLATEWWEENNQ